MNQADLFPRTVIVNTLNLIEKQVQSHLEDFDLDFSPDNECEPVKSKYKITSASREQSWTVAKGMVLGAQPKRELKRVRREALRTNKFTDISVSNSRFRLSWDSLLREEWCESPANGILSCIGQVFFWDTFGAIQYAINE